MVLISPAVPAGSDYWSVWRRCIIVAMSLGASPILDSEVTIWCILSWQWIFRKWELGCCFINYLFFLPHYIFLCFESQTQMAQIIFPEVCGNNVTKLWQSCEQIWQVLLIALPNWTRCKVETACLSSCLTASCKLSNSMSSVTRAADLNLPHQAHMLLAEASLFHNLNFLRLTCEFFSVSVSLFMLDRYPVYTHLTQYSVHSRQILSTNTSRYLYKQLQDAICLHLCPFIWKIIIQELAFGRPLLHAEKQKIKYLILMTNVCVNFLCIVDVNAIPTPHCIWRTLTHPPDTLQ